MDCKQILSGFLQKIAKEQNYTNYKLSIKEVSSGGANYTSKIFTAVISETGKDDLQLFAKIAILKQRLREETGINVYKSENYFYTKLLKIYRNIEDTYQLTSEQRVSLPKCYGCDPTILQEIIVLENLVTKGYRPYDRFTTIDWEYASSAVKELAKLHALSFALNNTYPQEYEECIKEFKDAYTLEMFADLLEPSIDLAVQNVKPENKAFLIKYIDSIMKPNFFKQYEPVMKTVLCHYDFRSSNLMSKRHENGKVDMKIVDLQTMQGGSPVVDLLYFIFTGSDEAFRSQYYDKLIEYYYEQLSTAMKRLHLDPDETYSRADFDYELMKKMPFGLSIAIFVLPLVTVEAEDAPKVDEDINVASFSVQKTSKLYSVRFNGVVNDFVKWGMLN